MLPSQGQLSVLALQMNPTAWIGHEWLVLMAPKYGPGDKQVDGRWPLHAGLWSAPQAMHWLLLP